MLKMLPSLQESIVKVVEWHSFLPDTPPGHEVEVTNLYQGGSLQPTFDPLTLNRPHLTMHCPHAQCEGLRTFHNLDETIALQSGVWTQHFLTYQCRNCSDVQKTFAVRVKPGLYTGGFASKIGEWPPFGPIVPPRT